MSKILFATRKEGQNQTVNAKIKSKLDCEFTVIDARALLENVNKNNVKIVVLYLTRMSADEELEVNKFLANSANIPVILAGERKDLSRYYEKTNANIIRYICTPILMSTYIHEIKEMLTKLEGGNEKLETLQLADESSTAKHILVVDDDITMLRTINYWLNDLFKVSVAKSGAAAIQFLAKQKPDLILLDYNMPVCDGIQTLEMIRGIKDLSNIPVFFLTGVDDNSQVVKALALKPQGYILKSNGPDYLISKIEAYL